MKIHCGSKKGLSTKGRIGGSFEDLKLRRFPNNLKMCYKVDGIKRKQI